MESGLLHYPDERWLPTAGGVLTSTTYRPTRGCTG